MNEQREEARLLMIQDYVARHEEYPQYAGKERTMRLAKAVRRMEGKSGMIAEKGDFLLLDTASLCEPDWVPEGEVMVTVWSPKKHHGPTGTHFQVHLCDVAVIL